MLSKVAAEIIHNNAEWLAHDSAADTAGLSQWTNLTYRADGSDKEDWFLQTMILGLIDNAEAPIDNAERFDKMRWLLSEMIR